MVLTISTSKRGRKLSFSEGTFQFLVFYFITHYYVGYLENLYVLKICNFV